MRGRFLFQPPSGSPFVPPVCVSALLYRRPPGTLFVLQLLPQFLSPFSHAFSSVVRDAGGKLGVGWSGGVGIVLNRCLRLILPDLALHHHFL